MVIGPNPLGNLKRLINSINSENHIFLKGNNAKRSVVFVSDVALFIRNWLSQANRNSGILNVCNNESPTINQLEFLIQKYLRAKFRLVVPIAFFFNLVNFLKRNYSFTTPIMGKLFYSLTFSDALARNEYGYTSKELNQTTFNNELNTNS